MCLTCTALDGQLKHEDTNLASSTLVHDPTQKENLGIIVQYKVGENRIKKRRHWQSLKHECKTTRTRNNKMWKQEKSNEMKK